MLLNGKNQAEKSLQQRMLSFLVKELEEESTLDNDDFILLVEDVAGNRPLSVNYMRKLLEQTGAFVCTNGVWAYNKDFGLNENKIEWEEFRKLFGIQKVIPMVTTDDAEKDAIISGIKWCIHMTQLAENEEMQGLPAFLRCGDSDELIGSKVAGTATSDALSLLCNGIEYLSECAIDADVLTKCFGFLISQILVCQCTKGEWDCGGFYPLEDQPDAEHPTVDATCLAMMALCDFYSNWTTLEKELHIHIEYNKALIERAVMEGLAFLFRMEQPEGSYGIYRYEAEYPDGNTLDENCKTGFAMPNENCTRLVLSTMGVCKGSGIFDALNQDEMYGICNDHIKKAYSYLKKKTADYAGYSIWAPYFGNTPQNYPIGDLVVSAARVCRSFIPVWWMLEEEREMIQKYVLDFMYFWNQEAVNVKGKVGRYSFKTPGTEKYSGGLYMWQSYPEMLAAFSVLQGYNLFGIPLKKEDWRLINDTVQETLRMQHPHGHWNAPKTSNPFCAVTLAAIELLREYRKAKQ